MTKQIAQLRRQVKDLRSDVSPTPTIMGGMLAPTERKKFIKSSFTTYMENGSIGLNDLAVDLTNNTTYVTKVEVIIPPQCGGYVKYTPHVIMSGTTEDFGQITRNFVPRMSQQKCILDIPDAHQLPVTTTEETGKFLNLGLTNMTGNTARAWVKVYYKTVLTVTL